MSLAATAAHLLVYIEGHDQLSPAVASASGSLSKLNETNKLVTNSSTQLAAAQKYGVNLASNSSVAFGIAKAAVNDFGNAVSHAKGFVTNLIQGPLGMIGLGAAAFSVAGALKSGIDTANELAGTLEKLTAITGLSDESLSALVAVTDKYGISQQQLITTASFAEKTIGKLNETMTKGKDPVSKLTQLDQLYGITLVDNTGKAVDFQTELLRVADYYTSNATASQKAALAAQLFGRGYQAMIPILALGSKGIQDAEKAAADLGLTLNATNVNDLQKYQAAMRDAGEAAAGLKLTLAETLIPTLTDLARSFTAFVTDHRTDIKQFFLGAISAAKTIGSALLSVGQLAKSAWDAIPGPLQTLMIQALIGNKVIKTVFGIDIVGSVAGAVASIGKNLLGSLVGSLFGKTIATPVVNVDGAVVNVAGGVGGGGPLPNLVKDAENNGGSLIATIAAAVKFGVAGIAVPIGALTLFNENVLKPFLGQLPFAPTPDKLPGGGSSPSSPGTKAGDAMVAAYKASLAAQNATTAAVKSSALADSRSAELLAQDINHGTTAEGVAFQFANSALKNIVGLTSAQTTAIDNNLNLQRIANESHHKLTYAQLLAIQHTEHTDHLAHMVVVNEQLAKAQDIFKSSESNAQKVEQLRKIQADFADKKDWGPEAQVRAEVAALIPHLDGIRNSIGGLSSSAESHPGKVKDDRVYVAPPSHKTNTVAAKKSNRLGSPGYA